MSDTPEIPEAAYAAGARAIQRYTETELRAHVAAGYVLDAAAPLICAHELRSVADELEWAQQELLEHRGFRSDGLAQALSHLRARANQRDGGVTRSGRDS